MTFDKQECTSESDFDKHGEKNSGAGMACGELEGTQ